jgi:hypothetical protein
MSGRGPDTRTDDAMSQPDPAQVFEDRMYAGEWRVQWFNDDGDYEVAIFSGPKARERAIQYAERQYGIFRGTPLRSVSSDAAVTVANPG